MWRSRSKVGAAVRKSNQQSDEVYEARETRKEERKQRQGKAKGKSPREPIEEHTNVRGTSQPPTQGLRISDGYWKGVSGYCIGAGRVCSVCTVKVPDTRRVTTGILPLYFCYIYRVPAFPPFQLVIEVIRVTFHVGGLLTILQWKCRCHMH